jgi:AcrR family transcriptional regulator
MQKKSKTRFELHKEAAQSTQSRLMSAALAAVEELGQSEVTVAEVISRAGVARGTYYLYFKDRNDILRSVALDFIDGLESALGMLPVTNDLQNLLADVMNCYVKYIVEHSVAAGLSYQLASQDHAVMQSFDLLIQKWAKNAAVAISRTGSSGEDLPTLNQLSLSMICMLEGYFRYQLRSKNMTALALQKEADQTALTFAKIWYKSVSK